MYITKVINRLIRLLPHFQDIHLPSLKIDIIFLIVASLLIVFSIPVFSYVNPAATQKTSQYDKQPPPSIKTPHQKRQPVNT